MNDSNARYVRRICTSPLIGELMDAVVLGDRPSVSLVVALEHGEVDRAWLRASYIEVGLIAQALHEYEMPEPLATTARRRAHGAARLLSLASRGAEAYAQACAQHGDFVLDLDKCFRTFETINEYVALCSPRIARAVRPPTTQEVAWCVSLR